MWATQHPLGGYHHQHPHSNSFLAGIYYLDGDADTGGTDFYPPYYHHNIIVPARIKGAERTFLKSSEKMPFEEGTLIIFPAWLVHGTRKHGSEKKRTVLSFNVMPIGKTNVDLFDRFNYQAVEPEDMINEREDGVGF
jgi:uncharacterized protein (TIGR02466 family)